MSRRSKRNSRSRRGQRDTFPWAWLVLVVIVLAVIAGGFAWIFKQARDQHVELIGRAHV